MYGSTDQRVVGLAMANVWARTPQIQASARLKHYYVRRLISAGFWRNVVCGRIAVRASLTDFARDMRMSRTKPAERYLDRMDEAFRRFRGPVLFILSGEDQGAREFEEWVGRNDVRVDLFRSSTSEVFRVNGADHTFSRSEWCDAVSSKTIEWIHDSVVPGVAR